MTLSCFQKLKVPCLVHSNKTDEVCEKKKTLHKDRNSVQLLLPLSEHERGLGLALVVDGGRAADDDGGPAVPPQRVLQDAGHLTVPVRHVGFLENKRHAFNSHS